LHQHGFKPKNELVHLNLERSSANLIFEPWWCMQCIVNCDHVDDI